MAGVCVCLCECVCRLWLHGDADELFTGVCVFKVASRNIHVEVVDWNV